MPVQFGTISLNELIRPYVIVWPNGSDEGASCPTCKFLMKDHGWIGGKGIQGRKNNKDSCGRVVCPGDAVVLVSQVQGIEGWKCP
jgi:hypothetical protein